jgi:hypothetical protein
MITLGDVVLALTSGALGAIGAEIVSVWHFGKLAKDYAALAKQLEAERHVFEIHRIKLEALRKIAGARTALSPLTFRENVRRFYEGLNEVMVIFSDSNAVSSALIAFKAALGTPNSNDRLLDLFKAMCRDVGIEPSALNDSMFLQPFLPGPSGQTLHPLDR